MKAKSPVDGAGTVTGDRILVVEDNPLNLKLVRDVLAVLGYDVIAATTGEEGVRLAHECAPDLVLMDLQLPGIDGHAALARMRSDRRTAQIPVVALTAFAMQQDHDRAREAGFDGYLEKPISVRHFPDQVRRHLRTEQP